MIGYKKRKSQVGYRILSNHIYTLRSFFVHIEAHFMFDKKKIVYIFFLDKITFMFYILLILTQK